MARQTRRTVPLDSKVGSLETFAEQEPELIAAEWRGRAWVFEQASAGIYPSDHGIFDLHRAMFQPLLKWAGEPRNKDAGPSGIVNVPFARVREETRKFGGDFDAWREDLGLDPTLGEIANLVADAHHRFQWIHPFEDTNG